jgi:hypothetical protein
MKRFLVVCFVCAAVGLAATASAWASPGRFVNNGDGTVTDGGTGLMWQRQDNGSAYTWVNALAYCEGLSLGGQSDWRLPNIKELRSIVDDSRYNPAIDTSVFPGTSSSYYWSSSSYAHYAYDAWQVDFYSGGVLSNDKIYGLYARCVRQ